MPGGIISAGVDALARSGRLIGDDGLPGGPAIRLEALLGEGRELVAVPLVEGLAPGVHALHALPGGHRAEAVLVQSSVEEQRREASCSIYKNFEGAVMELVILAAAAVALAVHVHRNPVRSVGPHDIYTAWLVRQQKPALHR